MQAVIAALYALTTGSRATSFGLIGGAIILAIVARVWREMSLMVAELADAVRTASGKR